MDTAHRYRRFAEIEAWGYSPRYAELADGVASDRALLDCLDRLPYPKRQPNLLLASVRFLGGPVDGWEAFRGWTLGHWAEVAGTMLARRTQTNEVGRCATLLPLLAGLPQPLALIEVGASAGLCLYPDRYRYRYVDGAGRHDVGPRDSPVTVVCRTTGPVPLPAAVPTVVWRAGVDLNPLDLDDPDDVRWLECLVWPEHTDRLRRLRTAIGIARGEPAHLVRGDLNDEIRALVAEAPPDATPVVFHSAVLAYLAEPGRLAFADTVRALPGRWISNEVPAALPEVERRLGRVPADRAVCALALDGRPVALAGTHGQSLDWLA